MFNASVSLHDIVFMLRGAGVTLVLTFWAVLGGTALGHRLRSLVRASCPGVAERGARPGSRRVPLGAAADPDHPGERLRADHRASTSKSFTIACIVLAVYGAAYCTEIVRGECSGRAAGDAACGAVARDELVGRSGRHRLSRWRCGSAFPRWIGLALGLMKDSALVLWIGIIELLRSSQIVVTRTQQPLLVLAIAGAIYFLISFPIARLGAWFERRWQTDD